MLAFGRFISGTSPSSSLLFFLCKLIAIMLSIHQAGRQQGQCRSLQCIVGVMVGAFRHDYACGCYNVHVA